MFIIKSTLYLYQFVEIEGKDHILIVIKMFTIYILIL